ncbi:MAG: LPS-assembly protein LptD, partial [Candidatus Binatia bacterium]
PGEGLTVDAANVTYDREANQVVARGRVTIAREGSLLTADEVRIDRGTKIGTATGNVQLSDPQGTIRAERFAVNLDDETGVLEEGQVYLNSTHMSITGEKFEKSYGQTYHIENGTFTTCQCGVGAPSWSIAGDEIDVALDGYGIVENATFRVMDVPILYLPIAAFPAKVSRQSGLLAPQFGFSKKRGLTFLQPLYVVVNKSADLTLSADVETEARIGGIAEYRYALDTRSRGAVNGAFFDEVFRNNAERDIVNQNVADPDIPEQRWSVTADMRQGLPWEVTGFTDVLAVSDDFYLREIPTFSFDPQYERTLRTSRYTQSRAGLYRLWDRATVLGQVIYYQDFIQEDDLTLQRLPQVSAFASERFFDRRLKLRFTGEAVNFARREGFDGPRVDVYPSAEVPFRWQEYLRGGLNAGFRETAYHLNNTDLIVPISDSGSVQETDPAVAGISTSPTRELFIAGADIGTELNRVFVVDGENVEKLKHTIEPGVEYLYVPEVDQDDLPFYDFTDRINQRNLVTYGVKTRLLAKLRKAPAAEANPLGPGELNAFTGVAEAPFDDERTRGPFGAIGGLEAPLSDAEAPPGEDVREEEYDEPLTP